MGGKNLGPGVNIEKKPLSQGLYIPMVLLKKSIEKTTSKSAIPLMGIGFLSGSPGNTQSYTTLSICLCV